MPSFSLCFTQVPLIIEGVQKRTLLCIFPGISYNETLVFSSMDCLRVYQEQITNQLFQSVVNNPSNKILSEGLLAKRVAGQLTIKGDTGFSTYTKLKTSGHLYQQKQLYGNIFVTYSLHSKLFFLITIS